MSATSSGVLLKTEVGIRYKRGADISQYEYTLFDYDK